MNSRIVVAAAVLLVLGRSALGQGDSLTCSTLAVDRLESVISGAGLSVCAVSTAQCCTQQFLDRIQSQVREDLLNGLRAQLSGRMNGLQGIFDRISTYLEGDFLSSVRSAIPGESLIRNQITQVTSRLGGILDRANFAINDDNPEFNTTQVFVDIIDGIRTALSSSSILNSDQISCISERLQQSINITSLVALGRSLESLRRSYSVISRVVRFLQDFNSGLDGFNEDSFASQCIRRAIEVSFCGRCSARIPPLCRNTCGALVRGCFAGFYSGLEGEFNNLWNVTGQVVRAIDANIREIFFQEGRFINLNPLSLVSECSIQLPSDIFGRKKRQSNVPDFLPQNILSEVARFSGLFEYGSSGPVFCAIDRDEENFCASDQGDTGADRSCETEEVCTSTCQCWDGEAMSTTNTIQFNGVRIEEQDGNPVVTIPEDVNIAIARARSTIVTSFLTSDDIDEITPEGVTIPPPASYGGGGITLTVSMATVLVSLLLAIVSA